MVTVLSSPILFSFSLVCLFVLVFQMGSNSVIQAGILLTTQAGLELEILLFQTECQVTGVLPSASGSHGREITS